jgi:peptidoglycan/xylan/chitin deacetylase (PgdA/CDA1 family)
MLLAISLTFDDGPSESTPEILDILAGHRVPGDLLPVRRQCGPLPGIAREVAARGHEIGNHSYSHPYLFLRSPGRDRK